MWCYAEAPDATCLMRELRLVPKRRGSRPLHQSLNNHQDGSSP
ncbi:hypothetical protein JCM19233_1605 [Vibrio astriarenae]|nr:hypothetical protein JCM19233_1605 [Vibrio sp. C7]